MINQLGFAAWAAVLFFQNISFTYVSRARNSGSLARHAKASVFSNGIWIISQMIMLGPMFAYLTGKHGIPALIAAGAVYTAACLSGSIFAHYLAMKTEKGKNAVGANKRYAQIPVDDWVYFQDVLRMARLNSDGQPDYPVFVSQIVAIETQAQRAEHLAEQAYDIQVNAIPSAGPATTKGAIDPKFMTKKQ